MFVEKKKGNVEKGEEKGLLDPSWGLSDTSDEIDYVNKYDYIGIRSSSQPTHYQD
ncbi:MAG: hypothetical protein GY806_08350 [Gammaproteobacteria bacterium]|nr:hypothetical protein [Gammaproteobacteria bacterium]